MPDESIAPSLPESNKPDKVDLPKIKNVKDWITAAIGAAATAFIPSLVFKGLVVAGAPFLSEGILWTVREGAIAFKARRKANEPLRIAKTYRKTIVSNLKQTRPNSSERKQLKADLAQIDSFIHAFMMHKLRYSVSTSLPVAPPPLVIPIQSALTPPPDANTSLPPEL